MNVPFFLADSGSEVVASSFTSSSERGSATSPDASTLTSLAASSVSAGLTS